MKLRLKTLALTLPALFLAALAARAQRTALPSPAIPDGFGVNIHFTNAAPEELGALGRSGVRFVRMDFSWSRVERVKGEYDFSPYDTLLAAMSKLGIRCLFILDYSNRLYDDGLSPHTDEGRAAFAHFAAAAAKHFAGQGVLWEIWNEPNIGQFWKPKPSAEDYSALALATIDAVRRADPNAFIMGPASSTFPWDFFETMGQRGVFARLDAVSVHPYRRGEPESAEADYARLRALIDRYAPSRNLPIVSGEWGYTTVDVSEEQQADYLVRQRLLNLSLQIPLSIWYDWKEDGVDPKSGSTISEPCAPASSPSQATRPGRRFRRRWRATASCAAWRWRIPKTTSCCSRKRTKPPMPRGARVRRTLSSWLSPAA